MIQAKKQIHIDAPVDKVFAFAIEPFVPNKRVVTENKEGIPSTFFWDYSAKDGGTTIVVVVEYTVPVPVLGKLAEKVIVRMNENEMDTLLANLKAVMEA
jgi:uncharacterized membrane protein